MGNPETFPEEVPAEPRYSFTMPDGGRFHLIVRRRDSKEIFSFIHDYLPLPQDAEYADLPEGYVIQTTDYIPYLGKSSENR